jgi:hypothetical protein
VNGRSAHARSAAPFVYSAFVWVQESRFFAT